MKKIFFTLGLLLVGATAFASNNGKTVINDVALAEEAKTITFEQDVALEAADGGITIIIIRDGEIIVIQA
ncbi:MAG: hypothetical protein Q4G08_02500 [Capnocytophaga sp.]|nr:hypothetical protein [Capnocytophaga sp.]